MGIFGHVFEKKKPKITNSSSNSFLFRFKFYMENKEKLLKLDLNLPNIDSSLFSIMVSKTFLYIDVFFINFKIFDKHEKKYLE